MGPTVYCEHAGSAERGASKEAANGDVLHNSTRAGLHVEEVHQGSSEPSGLGGGSPKQQELDAARPDSLRWVWALPSLAGTRLGGGWGSRGVLKCLLVLLLVYAPVQMSHAFLVVFFLVSRPYLLLLSLTSA